MSRAVLCAVVLSLGVADPAAAQIVRVSVSTGGAEANNGSLYPSISANGRFVAFASAASNLVAGDTNDVYDVFVRDRDTDADGVFDEPGAVSTTRISLGAGGAQADGPSYVTAMTPDGRYVLFLSQAENLGAANPQHQLQLYRFDRQTSTLILVTAGPGGAPPLSASASSPAISDDGNLVAFLSSGDSGLVAGAPDGIHVYVRNIAQGQTTIAPEPADWAALPANWRYIDRVSLSADGSRVAYLALIRATLTQFMNPGLHAAVVADLAAGTVTPVPVPLDTKFFTLSASGASTVVGTANFPLVNSAGTLFRRVVGTGATTPAFTVPAGGVALAATSPSVRYALTANALLHDFDFGTSTSLGFVQTTASFGSDRWLVVTSGSDTLVSGDTNGVDDVFVVDLADRLDADDDGMDDRWETLYGVTDPAADPDSDGQTNLQEFTAGTHPNGQVRRFLAEGATGMFFHTAIALANPNPTLPAAALLTFDRGDGPRIRRSLGVPAGRSVVVDAGAVTGLEFADVSTTVESDRFLAVERSMTWGATGGLIYGSSSEIATPSPSPTWFLAEGSTVLGFDLFYLLQNPQATTTHATVRFLLPDGTTINRTYDLAPGSRTTIYVNQVPGLDETDVSGDISADAPIVVERAMYRGTPEQPFVLGTESMGVPAGKTSWFLAEGATGTFFDLYVLIANPGNIDASVHATFLRPDGTTVQRSYTVRAHSRFSVYVDAIPGLEATSVATTLTSSVPIVAERAMYWPGGFFDYYEGHSSAGSTTTALAWVVAGGEYEPVVTTQTFVLVANTENRTGEATVTILPEAGSTTPAIAPFVIPLPASSRTTIPVTASGRFGVLVQSTGASPVQIVVESAVYRSTAGVTWSAGSNALATPMP